MLLTEVKEGIFELRLPIPWEGGWVNCFLLPDGDRVDLVDCGLNNPDSIALIEEGVREVGGRRGHLGALVVTHIHPDHFGAAGELVLHHGARLYLHRLEVPLVSPRYQEVDTLVEEVGRWLSLHGVPQQVAEEMKNASRWLRELVDPGQPALQLDGAEMLHLGRRRLRVEWTPGHSPGHVCLYDPADRTLFAGDQILPDASPNVGLHPQSTSDPLDDYLEGLRRLVDLEPGLVLPAHGRPQAGTAGRAGQVRAHHRRRKLQIERLVTEQPMTAWEVAIAIWGPREHIHDQRLALQEGLAHLQSLAREGRVIKEASTVRVEWRRP
ncbi:MAG: MBL fold metallo-hydrolase [Candidatus Dormibacteraeota bacterium]|nr:MBL fold metallo-hydrolase [Candidatus Dormibacteraeota bacterium]